MVPMSVGINNVFYLFLYFIHHLGRKSGTGQRIDHHHPFDGLYPGRTGNGQRSHMNIRQGMGKYHFLPGKYCSLLPSHLGFLLSILSVMVLL